MSFHQLVIVHPENSVRALMSSMLRSMGHKIEEAVGEQGVLDLIEERRADLLLVSSDRVAGLDPLNLLSQVRRKYPHLPVLMFTSEPKADRAREVMLRGARSVLRFPIPANQLRAVVSQALEDVAPIRQAAAREVVGQVVNGTSAANVKTGGSRPGTALQMPMEAALVGETPAFRLAIELVDAVAPTRAPVLILGESGSGKSALARRLHGKSLRHQGLFLEFSCAGRTEAELTIELFGKASGSSGLNRPGVVEQASGGTLVLNQVGDLPLPLQLRLLRLLREGVYVPVDGEIPQAADCRIVTTNLEDLTERVEDGLFRADLHQAVSIVSLTLPPLRKRTVDIPALVNHFRAQESEKLGPGVPEFSALALRTLKEHSWPGNLKELRSVVRRVLIDCVEPQVLPGHLCLTERDGESAASRSHMHTGSLPSESLMDQSILPLREALEEPEKQLILEALKALNWNRQETARVLDINRSTLYKKMKKYGLIFEEPVWVN